MNEQIKLIKERIRWYIKECDEYMKLHKDAVSVGLCESKKNMCKTILDHINSLHKKTMTDNRIEAIKTEIRRRKEINKYADTPGYLMEDNAILEFIEGLGDESETSGGSKPDLDQELKDDLEIEFNRFLDDEEGMPRVWHSEEQLEWGKDIARHFAKWQKNQMMKNAVDATAEFAYCDHRDSYFSVNHEDYIRKSDIQLSDTDSPELWRIKEEGNIIIPYLRSLNTMTEEEREELSDYLCERVMSDKSGITFPPDPIHGKGIPFEWMGSCIDWLNKHHFDYRGLIKKGLALEALEGMYKF